MWQGTIHSLHIVKAASDSPIALTEAHLVPGKGIEGDRYFNGLGFYSDKPGPDREVTLIEREVLEALQREQQIALAPGASRRNIVTVGVPLNDLVGYEFRVGAVTLRGIRLCEPCLHLESLTQPGVMKALIHRGGLRAQILSEGTVRVGDSMHESA